MRYLSLVDEFGQRNICVVAKNVNILETVGGAILEFDAEEVTEVGGLSSAQLDGNSGSVVGYDHEDEYIFKSQEATHTDALQLWVLIDNASLVEE